MTQELETEISNLRTVISSIRKLAPLVWALIIGAFGLGGWVATIQWNQLVYAETLKEQETLVHEFEIWQARTDANRFTTYDGTTLSNTLVDALNNQDKRLQKTEILIDSINKTLTKIEQKIQ